MKRLRSVILFLIPVALGVVLGFTAWRRHRYFVARAATVSLLKEVSRPQPRIAEVKALIAQGANVNARDTNGNTPLLLVIENVDDVGQTTQFLQTLLKAGSQVNAKDKEGDTPLTVTASQADEENSRFLLAQGAQINVRNNDGYTPLLCAAYAEDGSSVVHLLLDHGANPNDRMRDASSFPSHTALMLAVMINEPESVRLLLARGANPNIKEGVHELGMVTPLGFVTFGSGYDGQSSASRKEREIELLLRHAGAKP